MEERYSTESAGLLLGKFGILLLFAGFLLAAWAGQIIIAIILGMAIAAGGLTWLWSRISLAGVSCKREFSESRAFPGEIVEMRLQLFNRKLFPMPWVQADAEIPLELIPGAEKLDFQPGYGLVSKSASLLWYSKVSWSSDLHCTKRGYYKLGPLTVTSGDIFGFHTRSRNELQDDYIIVYPRLFPVENLVIPSAYPLGNANADRMIFEDPLRIMGVRDYSPHDSMKKIHWKASARQQTLQVKVLEPTTTLEAVVFLSIDSFLEAGVSEDDFEYGISTAASTAKFLLDKGNPTGLFVNTRLADSGKPARILPGNTMYQVVSVLETLAKVTRKQSNNFEEYLNGEYRALPWGTTIILVVYRLSDELKSILPHIKKSGYRLRVYQTGTPGPNTLHKDEPVYQEGEETIS